MGMISDKTGPVHADEMDRLRADLEVINAEILEHSRQAEHYTNMVLREVRKLSEIRMRLSDLTQRQYKNAERGTTNGT